MQPQQREYTPAAHLRARRAAAFRALAADVMVLAAAPVQYASRDTDRPYRPDSELFYLTGATEPDTVAVFVGGDVPEWILFVPPRDPDAELWAGPRLGPEEAAERLQPDACYPSTELEERLPDLLARGRRIHYRLGTGDRVERCVLSALTRARTRGPRTGTGPRGVLDPGGILDELRLRKDSHEIDRLRAAAELTLDGQREAARVVRPGVGEWEVQAELEATFARAKAAPAFGTIVGAGRNACVLHYRANDAPIPEDGLVLVDAGAELDLYNGDVTRTYPAKGRFSDAQRRIYDLVEAARRTAVDAVAPGRAVGEVHDAAVHVLVAGLRDLGILDGDVGALVEAGAHKPYFPHQTSHWLGLDVHDPGDYAWNGASRTLEADMVLTVEPALYFRPGGAVEAEPYTGIGVRIEDDVLVTETGHENLTANLPTASHDVEALLDEIR
ncbi:MAG: aminopeptidase P N-terminal domain-containing protein [Gemmatimonadota bacterium]|nr:aminopeptidase P N-terminal domain-containing protein [Gemmatimonadota bacterium]